MYILFTLISFLATLIGSVFGIGGGIIIKPALEAASDLPLSYVNALSGVTVLCMAAVSLAQYLRNGEKLTSRLIWLSLGATGGGFCGKYLFELMDFAMKDEYAKILQYTLLIFLMIAALLKNRFKTYDIRGRLAPLSAGVFMGTLSAFLGIGGGPVNLLAIYVALGLNPKKAAVYSIFAILCSQLSTVGLTAATGGYSLIDGRLLLYMVIAAAAGGLIGPVIQEKWDPARVEKSYRLLLLALIALNMYNIIQSIMKGVNII